MSVHDIRKKTGIKVNQFLDGNKIWKSQEVVLLGATINDKLSFKRVLKIFVKK